MGEPRVAVVTGASRGVGRGIALALGEAGWTVVLTGRQPTDGDTDLRRAADEVEHLGGRAVPVTCDHRDDAAITDLFAQVDRLGTGPDLLVNNVWAGPRMDEAGQRFWERPLEDWDLLVGLGLRAHYVASREAAARMVARGRGLIVNISSFGARRHLHSVPYGASKVGLDKMAADMATELDGTGVHTLSLWPGLVRTEAVVATHGDSVAGFPLAQAESPRFVGQVVATLADGDTATRSGHTLITAEVGRDHGIAEPSGQQPPSLREPFGGGPLFPT